MSEEDDKKHDETHEEPDKRPHLDDFPAPKKKEERELGEFERSDHGEEDSPEARLRQSETL